MHSADIHHPDLETTVKHYYRHVERYDWTRAADDLVGLETIFHRRRSRATVRLVRRYAASARCIDIGCGTALVTRHLPARAFGVDLNPRNLGLARRYSPTSLFAVSDAESGIPVREETFDVAVCTEMLEHLLRPDRALAEIHRILKPGGWLIGSVPGRSVVWKLRWLSASRDAFTEEPYHKHYRRSEIQALLARYFVLERLDARDLRMNWFFVGRRREITP